MRGTGVGDAHDLGVLGRPGVPASALLVRHGSHSRSHVLHIHSLTVCLEPKNELTDRMQSVSNDVSMDECRIIE
jgi:hypothetical protein